MTNRTSGSFRPEVSGEYELHIQKLTSQALKVAFSYELSPHKGVPSVDPINLDRLPHRENELGTAGRHAVTFTLPAEGKRTIPLDLSASETPLFGYTVEAKGGWPLSFKLTEPGQRAPADIAGICGLHMGGVKVAGAGRYLLEFHNSDTAPRPVTLWVEGYSASETEDFPPQEKRLEGWGVGDHKEEFLLVPGQKLSLIVSLDAVAVSGISYTVDGDHTARYEVFDPKGRKRSSGSNVAGSRDSTIAITESGDYVFLLENIAGTASNFVLSVSIR